MYVPNYKNIGQKFRKPRGVPNLGTIYLIHPKRVNCELNVGQIPLENPQMTRIHFPCKIMSQVYNVLDVYRFILPGEIFLHKVKLISFAKFGD